MADILLTSGIDTSGVSSGFAQMQQLAENAAAQIARIQAVLPTPKIDPGAFSNAGAQGGRAFADGVAREASRGDAFGGLIEQARGAAAAIGLAFSVHEITNAADEYQNVSNRLLSVSASAGAAARAQAEVGRIAEATRSSYEGVASLFARVTQASNGLGASQAQVARVTQTIAEALQLGGASAGEARRAVLDVAHAMTTEGAQGARALRAAFTQSPALAAAVAQGLGVQVQELTKLMHEGALGGETLFRGLDQAADAVHAKFAQITPTIAGALTNVQTAFTTYIGTASQVSGTGRAIAGSLQTVASNFDLVAQAALGVAAVSLARIVGPGVSAQVAGISEAVQGYRAQQAAILSTADASAIAARATLEEAGAERAAAEQRVAALRAVQTQLQQTAAAQREALASAAFVNERAAAVPLQTLAPLGAAAVEKEYGVRAAAIQQAAQASTALIQIETALESVDTQLASTTAAVAAAQGAEAGAARLAAVAQVELTVAQRATTVASEAGALASKGLGVVMAALGGEVGIAILAITGAVYWFQQHKSAAEQAAAATDTYRESVRKLTPIKLDLSITAGQTDVANLTAKANEIRASITGLQNLAKTASPLDKDRLTYEANRLSAQDLTVTLQQLAAARARVAAASDVRTVNNETAGRTGLTSAVDDAAIKQLAALRDKGIATASQLGQINQIIGRDRDELAAILAKPLPTDTFALNQRNARVLEIQAQIDALTKTTKVSRAITAQLTLDARDAAAKFKEFKAQSEQQVIRAQLALELNPFSQSARVQVEDQLQAQIGAAAAEVLAAQRAADNLNARATETQRAAAIGRITDALRSQAQAQRELNAMRTADANNPNLGDLNAQINQITRANAVPIAVTLGRIDVASSRQALADAFENLNIAKLAGDKAGIAAAQAGLDTAEASARRVRAALAQAFTALPGADQVQYLNEVSDALATLQVPDTGLERFASTLQTIGTAVGGVLNIAQAFGDVDESARKAVGGVGGLLNGLAQSASALAEIRKTNPDAGIGSLFGSVQGISGIVGAVGGLASIASSLFGSHPDPVVEANTQALNRLTSSLYDSFAKSGGGVAASIAAIQTLQRAGDTRFDSGADLQQFLSSLNTGVSFKELEAAARASGLELFDSHGRVTAGMLDQLTQALTIAANKAATFGDTLSDQRSKADLAAQLFGNPNATAQQQSLAKLNEELALLQSLAPNLGRTFAGLDTNTAAGRAAVLSGLQRLFLSIGNGLTAADLGKLEGINDLTSIISNADSALNDLAKSAAASADAIGNVPNAFKATLDALRFDATAAGLPGAIPAPAAVPYGDARPYGGSRTDAGGGSVVAPIVYSIANLNVTSTAPNAAGVFDDVEGELRRRALANGGSNHPAVRGLVSALGARLVS